MQKNKEELEREISLLISKLGNYGPTDSEHDATLTALNKATHALDTLTKCDLEESKAELENDRFEQEVSNREKQFQNEAAKIENDKQINEEKLALDKERLLNETAAKNRELALKEKADKRTFWLTLAGTLVPVTISVVTNIVAMRFYNRLAVRALNMEYIDNSITPRSYNECMSNINKFVSKK